MTDPNMGGGQPFPPGKRESGAVVAPRSGPPPPPQSPPPPPPPPPPYEELAPAPYFPHLPAASFTHPNDASDTGWAPPGPARRKRRILWIGGAAFVVVAVLVTGTVLYVSGARIDGGSSSPDFAALDMLASIEANDPLEVAANIAPGETSGLAELFETAAAKSDEAGFDTDGDASALFQGLTVTSENVTTSVQQISETLAKVSFTSGVISSRFDPASAPDSIAGASGSSSGVTEGSATVEDFPVYRNYERQDPFVMAVQRDEKWYVSPLYTAAEYLAVDAGDQPNATADVVTAEYSSPDEAAAGFAAGLAESLSQRDITPLASTLPAVHGEVAAAYRTTFNRLFDDMEYVSAQVGDSSFSVAEANGSTFVTIDRLRFSGESSSDRVSGEIVNGCVNFTDSDGDTDQECNVNPFATFGLPGDALTGSDGTFRMIEDSVGWHVDVIGTALHSLRSSMESVTPKQLAFTLAGEFDVWSGFSGVNADETVDVGRSLDLVIQSGYAIPNERSRYEYGASVADVSANAGQPIDVTAESSSGDSFQIAVIGTEGVLARSYGEAESIWFETATDEVVKIVVLAEVADTVRITVS